MRDPHTPLASLERELRGTEATAGTLIDLHTHVLPGIDDGPATVEEAVDLARAIADSGVSTVVATPHVSFEYRTTPAQILEARDALRDALDAAGIALELVTGAEVDLSYGIDLDDDALAELRLAGGPFLLVESPLSPAAGDFDPMLLGLQNRGHRVVLAHPERCPAFQRQPERVERLVAAGMLCSITADSLAGRFGTTVRKFTADLLRRGLVHDVSSDTHDLRRRPPGLLGGLAAGEKAVKGLAAQRAWLTYAAPAAILAGAALPPRPELPTPRRRSWLRRA